MINLTPLLNRDGSLPADHWYHLVPRGEYPHKESGKLQVIDDKALDAMLNNFRPKLLIDQEHWSYDLERSSEAFGWLTEVQKRDDGLWGRVEWTDIGEPAVKNKRYRFLSPVWNPPDTEPLGKNRIRPLRLDSAGLTNTPNLRGMVPLSNRRVGQASSLSISAGNKPKGTMNSVATKLGLSAEASEDAILAAVTSITNERDGLKAEITPLKNRVTELESSNKSLLDAQVETDLDPLKNRLTEEEIKPLRDGLMKHREGTLPIVKTMISKLASPDTRRQTQDPGQRSLTNRASAKTPTDKAGATVTDDEQTARDREKEVRDYRLKNRCTNAEAWDAVRRDKPELFGIAVSN